MKSSFQKTISFISTLDWFIKGATHQALLSALETPRRRQPSLNLPDLFISNAPSPKGWTILSFVVHPPHNGAYLSPLPAPSLLEDRNCDFTGFGDASWLVA